MYRIIVLLVILTLGGIEKTYADNSRIIVLSDIGGSDPDDQQSMVHLLTLLDRIDLEGIIYQHAWVSFNKGNEVTVTEKIFDAYEKVSAGYGDLMRKPKSLKPKKSKIRLIG